LFEFSLYEDLTIAVAVDLILLVACTALLLRYGRLAHSHPAISYLFFHVIAVTSRVMAIIVGAETLFSYWGTFFEPVTEVEIARAVFFADMALVVMTTAWIRASYVDLKKTRHQPTDKKPPVTLSLSHIWRVVVIAFPIGVVGLALLGNVPGVEKPEIELGEWQESSWLGVTMTWAGLALLALIYWYGFRWWLLGPMGLYLLIMAVQGYHRFRVIIPLILLLQIYLDRRQKKWPPAFVLIPIILAMLLFYPLKSVGRLVQEGATLTEITETSSTAIREVIAGQHGDQTLLDQFASYLTLIDQAGKLYYGGTYLALATSPIPRQLWPEKPTLSEHLHDVSTVTRPMAEMGMTLSYMGEFYINFGFLGVIVMAYLTAYCLARIYFQAYHSNYFSVQRFTYLLIACNLIQVYRDGLMSLFIFTLVNMMPLSVIVLLHWLKPLRQKAAPSPLPAASPASR
jgi:hypothetical protein